MSTLEGDVDQSDAEGNAPASKIKKSFPMSKECVLALMKAYKDHSPMFKGGAKLKKSVWEAIAETLRQQGFQLNGDQCSQKWRNMTRSYTMFLERRQLPVPDGSKPEPAPWFFAEMADALNEQHFLSMVGENDLQRGELLYATCDDAGSKSTDDDHVTTTPLSVDLVASRAAVGSLSQMRSSKRLMASKRPSSTTDNTAMNSSDNDDNNDGDDDDDDEEFFPQQAKLTKRVRMNNEALKKSSEQVHGHHSTPANLLQHSNQLTCNGAEEKPPMDVAAILKAIHEADAARRLDDDTRHTTLLQELRRQHYEKMALLSNILDVLSRNCGSIGGGKKDGSGGSGNR